MTTQSVDSQPLDPPATAKPGYPLKAGFNYDFAISDAEVDRRAREGHGWIRPRPDGRHAKCGGTGLACGICRREEELFGEHRIRA